MPAINAKDVLLSQRDIRLNLNRIELDYEFILDYTYDKVKFLMNNNKKKLIELDKYMENAINKFFEDL